MYICTYNIYIYTYIHDVQKITIHKDNTESALNTFLNHYKHSFYLHNGSKTEAT